MTRLGWKPDDPLPGDGEHRFLPGDGNPYAEVGDGLQLIVEGDFGATNTGKVDWSIYGLKPGGGDYRSAGEQRASSAVEAVYWWLQGDGANWAVPGARFFTVRIGPQKGGLEKHLVGVLGYAFSLAEREPNRMKKTPFDTLNFAIVCFLRETSDPDNASLSAWAAARQKLMRDHSEAWTANEWIVDQQLTPRERQLRALGLLE